MAETWSTFIEAHGIRIRLYQRTKTGNIYREVRTPSGKSRKSLRTSDRDEAEGLAKDLAAEIAKQQLTGVTPETLTLEQLHRIYVRERGRLLSDRRKVAVRRAFRLWRKHLGDGFLIADLGQHQCETYEAARKAGTLAATWGSNGGGKVGASAVAAELGVLKTAIRWATGFKRDGKPLIRHNPIDNVSRPTNPNKARPVATRERFEKMVSVADRIDATGGFRTMLNVAWYTGRRFGSIAPLRASDVLLTPDQVASALGDAGKEEYLSEQWSAAIRWAAEHDKEDRLWIVPIPAVLAATLADYIKSRGIIGNALLFPARQDRTKPISKTTGYYRWNRAEELAGLKHQKQGGWHSFRRAWATARKHLPIQDVMAAGGWSDPAALQEAYQHEDAATIRAVMEVE